MLFRRKKQQEPMETHIEPETAAPRKTGYSEIYKTREALYRYNYDTQRLEKLKKVIRQISIDGTLSAVVQTVVESSFEVKQEWFDKEPEYWMNASEKPERLE